jgi:hypothetical protein
MRRVTARAPPSVMSNRTLPVVGSLQLLDVVEADAVEVGQIAWDGEMRASAALIGLVFLLIEA